MGNFIITIARQYGSGGRTIGHMLAKKLGISYYHREIIRMASDLSGIDESLFWKIEGGDKVKGSLFNRTGLYKGKLIPPDSKEFISDENLFSYQARVIYDLAEKESFVAVGRCVNYVLKDRPDTLRVFIHAPWEFRVQHASEKISGTREDVERFLQKDDKRKMEYYRRYAGGDWSDARGYDLCLNSEKLGYEKCVEEIEHMMRQIQ